MKVDSLQGLARRSANYGKALLVGTLAFFFICSSISAQDGNAVTPGTAVSAQITPVVSINVLMVMFVDQAADAIWTAAVTSPKKACEWEQVEYRATQLATTGTLLKVGGTGAYDMQWKNSPDWIRFAQDMTQYALAAAQAARQRDVAMLKTVSDKLIINCEACHREFKPSLPSQGIATHLTHATALSRSVSAAC